jgi:hypothetical protein
MNRGPPEYKTLMPITMVAKIGNKKGKKKYVKLAL